MKILFKQIFKACKPKKSGVYNVGTGNARSFEDIVNILQKELEIDNGKEYIPNPYVGSYQFFTEANILTTKKFLDYEPRFSLEDGIKAYIPEIKKIICGRGKMIKLNKKPNILVIGDLMIDHYLWGSCDRISP